MLRAYRTCAPRAPIWFFLSPCYRVLTAMQPGALDLVLSLAYSALLLVLIGLSYLVLVRRTNRK